MTNTKLRSVDRLEVIIIVDNSIDWSSANTHGNIFSPRQWANKKEDVLYLQGGHGFSVLLCAKSGTETRTVLYDAGPQESIIAHNVELLGIEMSEIDAVVMSHGHWDHFGGLIWSLKEIGTSGIPVHVHPRMFLPKAVKKQDGTQYDLPDISGEVSILESGGRIVSEKGPNMILDDTFLISGEIPRETEWEKGMKGHMAYTGGEWQDDTDIIDDRCLIVKVKGKGLVIVSGCSHAGIVNMVQHSIKLTSEERVEAIIGGLHLSNADSSAIEATTRSIEHIGPSMIVPTHCTGWKAQTHMQRILKQSFARSSVGNMYVFGM